MDELIKELKARGTAEIVNGIVTQVTQALDETDDEAEFIILGERHREKIIPIVQACAKCDHCYFTTVEQCQERQKRDAVARGFHKIICPQQFVAGH